MAKSILQREKECLFCGAVYGLESHHVFGGPLRKLSEHYGLKVWLCWKHHTGQPEGVHFCREAREELQEAAQKVAMKHYCWTKEDFIKIFGRNYIRED